jgi:hypothetical protein
MLGALNDTARRPSLLNRRAIGLARLIPARSSLTPASTRFPGDTIFAIASGAGRAALAVLRVSGPVTQQIVESVAGSLPEPCFAALKTFRDPATGAVGMICPS